MSAIIDRKLRQAADCFNAGDYTQAEALCQRVLKRAPRNPDALHLMGILRLSGGRAGEAIPLLRGSLRTSDRNIGALEALGTALLTVGDHPQAEQVIRRLMEMGGASPVRRMRLGIALASQGRLTDAIPHFEEAVRSAPDFADAHYNLGNALMELHRPQDALACFQRALALEPGHVDAQNALGTALQEVGRIDEAISAYHRALELDERHAMAHQNLGNALWEQGRLEDAARCFARAIALKPDYVRAYSSLGAVRQEQGRSDEGIACLEQALTLNPGSAEAQYNLALARLSRQEFERAWSPYEQRVHCDGVRERVRRDAATLERFGRLPRWRGPAEEPHQTVAIWAEQGIGDQVLFSSLMPDLIAAGTRFVYEVDRRLLPAYERSFPGQRFVPLSDPPDPVLEQADRVLLAGSLPGLFRRQREEFARQPRKFLNARPERVAHYRRLLEASGAGLKVALSWRSSRVDRVGPKKTVPLAVFEPLVTLPGVRFVDVQYGDTAAERQALEAATGVRLTHFDEVDTFNDLDELLAMLEACDLLISTSNATVHVAGALGKPVWLLFPADNPPFHYWAHGGSYRSPWYPSVEIVTRADLADWASLIGHATGRLQQLCARPGA